MQKLPFLSVLIVCLAGAACAPTPPPYVPYSGYGIDGTASFGETVQDAGQATATDTGSGTIDIGVPPTDSGAKDAITATDAGPKDSGPVDSGVPPCTPTNPPAEKCDGIDNDCNGETDDLSCVIPGNACTVGKCDSARALKGEDGCVWSQPEGVPCDDGNKCTLDDACKGGSCASGPAVACNDNNSCTLDDCNSGTGKCDYVTFPNGIICDDGKPCTNADKCLAGICVGQMTAFCEDGEPCTADDCDTTGACIHKSLDGAACTDGNACSTDDACGLGKCLPGKAVICNDDNKCTDDICDPKAGCVHKPIETGKSCSDGVCSKEGKCNAQGVCEGEVGQCADQDPCTDDKCTPLTGCQFVPVAENTPCGLGQFCKSNAKVPHEAPGKPKLPLPDNDPIGVNDTIDFPDKGVAESLEIKLVMTNSDLSGVTVLMYDPNNTKYVLHDGGPGTTKDTIFPTLTKPEDGNLYSWIGKNPKGKWRLLATDLKGGPGGMDGEITFWSVKTTMTIPKLTCVGQ